MIYRLSLVEGYSLELDPFARAELAKQKDYLNLRAARLALRRLNLKLSERVKSGKGKYFLPRIDIVAENGRVYKWGG
jgi:hypothetical protein